jgi:hypothetical protein
MKTSQFGNRSLTPIYLTPIYNGKDGVVITSNVIVGHGPKGGTTRGRGLEGFAKLTWDAAEHDVTPTAEAPFDRADAAYLFEIDFTGRKRPGPTSGAQIP